MKLTAFEERQAACLFETFLPSGFPGLELGAKEVNAVAFLHQYLERVPPRTKIGLRGALVLLAFLPLWGALRFSTLKGLPAPERLALLERIHHSPIYLVRQLVFLAREVACMAYGADPRVRRAIEAATIEPSSSGGINV